MQPNPKQPLENSLAWRYLSFRTLDVLEDNALELSELANLPVAQARTLIQNVLDYYHYRRTGYPADLDRCLFHLILHLTQPFRIPVMTSRIDSVLDQLKGILPGATLLDYGGGGGKDSIILAKAGCQVTFADFSNNTLIAYVQKRFATRGLNIPTLDVRDVGGRRFDMINCLDVIEHVYDVEYVVADLVAHLNGGGHLLCWPAFFNDWTGEHIEKNCGYGAYFPTLLERAGLRLVEGRIDIMGLVKERPCCGTVEAERETIRKGLYSISRRLALRSAEKAIVLLPLRLLKGQMSIRDPQRRTDARHNAISKIIDNLAIWRLSDHRLKSDMK